MSLSSIDTLFAGALRGVGVTADFTFGTSAVLVALRTLNNRLGLSAWADTHAVTINNKAATLLNCVVKAFIIRVF